MNEMTAANNNQNVEILDQTSQRQPPYASRYPMYDVQRIGKIVDELISGNQDDRMNTKRAISGSVASAARVQNQNDRIIDICERELRRKDLSEEQRKDYVLMAQQAARSSADTDRENRAFAREETKHSHRANWLLIGSLVVLVGGGVWLSVA